MSGLDDITLLASLDVILIFLCVNVQAEKIKAKENNYMRYYLFCITCLKTTE